jgi:hypothetical protein
MRWAVSKWVKGVGMGLILTIRRGEIEGLGKTKYNSIDPTERTPRYKDEQNREEGIRTLNASPLRSEGLGRRQGIGDSDEDHHAGRLITLKTRYTCVKLFLSMPKNRA